MKIDLPWYAKAVFRAGPPLAMVAALVMSVPGEIHLAEAAGWSPGYARLMPVCVSAYAACAAIIAEVAKRLALPNRTSALWGAGLALVLALAAQGISHLIALGYMATSVGLVIGVSAIPPLVAAHMLHMAAAPAQLSSVVEAEDVDDDELLAGDAKKRSGRTRERGRRRLDPAAVLAAAEELRAAGQKVTGAALGQKLGTSRRTGTRYRQLLPAELLTG
ncbi:hypothetical protein [Kitasatospora cineracea]|uniref:hypothetical protein n=1 Tax=Kitasatospora cineracea TaxID=88074 RepID=UPI0033FD2E1C